MDIRYLAGEPCPVAGATRLVDWPIDHRRATFRVLGQPRAWRSGYTVGHRARSSGGDIAPGRAVTCEGTFDELI